MSGKLKMLSAGAGAGKTSRLSEEILTAIRNGVPPEKFMATTFTTKAADELIERVRLKLLEAGDATSAARILDGYVGTMNSVFGRLLREFALELGLSPVQKVLAETEAAKLFQAIAAEENDKLFQDYHQAFSRLGLAEANDNDWRKTVLEIIKVARENGMKPEDVQACAKYSWELMNQWLPEPLGNPEELDLNLRSALKVAKSSLPGGDSTKATAKVMDDINGALREWSRNGFLTWQQWAKLSKLKPGKNSADAVRPISSAASFHARHPRLHQDMKDVMTALFHCAAEAMETYMREKNKRGLIDFTDQESLALALLKDENNREALKDRISQVFVDEFQDSSPLQMALNIRLREIADSATWVGDVKQAIYGFRGTDPELMQTAMTSIPDIEVEVLDASWRSRRSLVELVNAIFVPVFEARGMTAERIQLNPKRDDQPEQALAVETWVYLHSKNQAEDAAHIAKGVQNVLANKEHYMIVDKVSREMRALRAGDMAILCRSNDECTRVAEALAKLGIPATVGESGLLATPEVVFAVAAIRYLVDRNDTLAIAELVHFSSETGGGGRWLTPWLEPQKRSEMINSELILLSLDKARAEIGQMSPSEVVDLALVTAKVDEVVLRWSQGDHRLANLDALRKLAAAFEESAGTNGTAATVSGFLLYLDDVAGDKELDSVAESTDNAAVRVLTYHKAKGLEWPFVILNSLEKSSKRKKLPVFDRVTAVSTKGFNVEDPLNGRSLYYWPWPYGAQSSNVMLDTYVQDSEELKAREQQLIDENQRLMYVGMTRARDYLVFTARDFSKVGWMDELTDAKGNPVLAGLGSTVMDQNDEPGPIEERKGSIIVKGKHFPCKVRELSLDEAIDTLQGDSETHAETAVYIGKTIKSPPFVPARFSPSKQRDGSLVSNGEPDESSKTGREEERSKIYKIGNRLPLSGNPDMAELGEMVHGFLAADNRNNTTEERLVMAKGLVGRFAINALPPEAMLTAADRLEDFLLQRYPDLISKHHEWPIHLRKGLQKASGWVDLLLLTPKGWVIVDHKTFPGTERDWLSRATGYLPQLRIYAEALIKATGLPVIEAWIHMPIVGAMVYFSKEELE